MLPKRVLHVVSAMNRGGTETLLMNVYREIDKTKIQFDFISHRKEACDYDDEIESMGGKVYRVASLGQSGPISYIKSIKNILSQQPYVALHSHTDFQSGFAALAAKQAGIKIIVCHAHTDCWEKKGILSNAFLFPTLRILIKYSATELCACSHEAARFLFGEKALSDVRILKNGINVDDFLTHGKLDLRGELDLPNDIKILGHVGNLSQVKNHTFILKILKQLREEGLEIVAVFAGDGPLHHDLLNEARQLGIDDYVHFLGVRTDIPKLMRAFDVFVFPSFNEGFGMVTLEAQCAGTSCVVSDAVPKSIDMGLDLIKFKSLSEPVETWAKVIKTALNHKRPSQTMIENGFKRSGFHIRENIAEWLTLYGVPG